MKTRQPSFRLDICVSLGQFLLSDGLLNRVQTLLCKHAPKWVTMLRVYRYREPNTPIDAALPSALAEAVRSRGLERGDLYYQLERQFPGPPPRLFGSAEIRGEGNALIIVPHFDERIVTRAGDASIWGNSIAFQICKPKVDGNDSVSWARTVFTAICESLSPWHAHSGMLEESDSKNISHEGGGTMAVGIDISRHLPGIYWMNFFGEPYRDFIGRDRLLTGPAHEVKEVDKGVLLSIDANPTLWDTAEYRRKEQQILNHIGPEYFFSKAEPERETITPDLRRWLAR